MNGGLILGLLGAAAVAGVVVVMAKDDDGTTECFNPLVLDTWGKDVHMPVLILNEDGTAYQVVGDIASQANGFLVWKAGTTTFKVTPDDDWEGRGAGKPFPWNEATPDRLATTNFNSWCANGGIPKAQGSVRNTSTGMPEVKGGVGKFSIANKVNGSVLRGGNNLV